MPPNDGRGSTPKRRSGVTRELRRAGWLSAAALSTIALTVFRFEALPDRADPSLPWIGTIAVCFEVLVALVATWWLSRQVVRHAGALERSVTEVEASRGRAESEAKQKARVVALLDAALGC